MESHRGFNFQPSDKLIIDFLKEKRLDPHFSHHPIKDIDHICSLEPWDLAAESITESDDQVWHYFFYEPSHPYKGSDRAYRRTKAGHWTITGGNPKIKARNGLTGTKYYLTFYLRGLDSKADAKTDWVMHEYHVNSDPSYKKEFVLCRIQRKQNKKRKRGISTTDEGESSQQLVSPPQQSPSDHSFSNGNHSEGNTPTIPHQQLQNHNSISYPGNLTVQNTIYPQSVSNHLISKRNHNYENIPTDFPLLQNHNWISCLGNHSEETTLTDHQQLPSHNWISYSGNGIEQNMYSFTYPWVIPNYSPNQQLPCDHLISARNYSEENIPINQQPQPNDNLISHFGNQIERNSPTNPPLPPYGNLELQLPLDHPLMTHNFAENNFQEDCLPIGEFKSYGGYNRLNGASFSTVQTAIYQEQELKYSNSSVDNCDLSDCLFDSVEQVNYLINSPRAFQHENSSEETGQTLIPDFNPLKSDGEALAYAEDSSDTNTVNNAWVKQLLDNYGRLLTGEFKSYIGYNRLNDASFPAVQTPIYQEQELKYSNSSFDDCDFSDHQVSSDEQVNSMINSSRAFQDENSCEETGQTLTPDFNPSKSDGEGLAYAEDSSDTNTACNDAWLKEQLENFA